MLTVLATITVSVAPAATQSIKPRVPAGRDPGGIAIAIIGGGLDYTRPEIAARLARDGEGEIVGWDFIDNDQRPFDTCSPATPALACPTALAADILAEAPAAALVAIRASTDRPQSLVQAVKMAAQSRARIVLLVPDGQQPLAPGFVAEAARLFPHHLFVVAMPMPGTAAAAANIVPATATTAKPDDEARRAAAQQAAARNAGRASRIAAAELGVGVAELARRLVRLPAPGRDAGAP